nr:protein NLRC3 isoform X2 [Tanacetum cinerariifolium]
MFAKGDGTTVVLSDLVICAVRLICLVLLIGVTGTRFVPRSVMLGQVKHDRFFPADLIFLATTNPDGVCYTEENRSITNIDLGGNDIHAKGITAIAEVLKDNGVITALELTYNPMGPDGAKALSDVLKFHGNIKTLMLGWCKGAKSLARSLKVVNEALVSLDLGFNEIKV